MTVVCAGLSPLLNLCASGIVPRSEVIHFLDYQNTWSNSWIKSVDPRREEFAKKIGEALGYEVHVHGPYKWHCSPDRVECEDPKISLDPNNNIITANTTFFLKNHLGGKSVELFPEGASCFSPFRSYESVFEKIKHRVYPYLKKLKNAGKNYRINKKWLLPDFDGIVESRVGLSDEFKMISSRNLYAGYDAATNFLVKKYPEIDFSNYVRPFFHPIVEHLGGEQYSSWIEGYQDLIGDSTLIMKPKPRDATCYEKIICGTNLVFVPREFGSLPAEIFIRQTDMSYLGQFSTLLLAFPRSRTHLIFAPNQELRLDNLRKYVGMRGILSL